MGQVSADSHERDALSLVTNGFHVFPVAPGGKAPPLVRFTRDASTDAVAVADWWREHPEANIGVRAGGGTLILDCDDYKAEDPLDGLDLPDTPTVRTPRGGRHLYFTVTGRAPNTADVRPGVDFRGEGGYALGPGSVIDGRRYRWLVAPWELEPQPAPRPLLDLARERGKRAALDAGPIAQGARNVTLTRIAGSFVRHGISGEGLRAGLQAVNRERCRPPLSEREVERIVASASKWTSPPGWVTDPIGFSEDARLDAKARHLLAIFAARAAHDGKVRGGSWLESASGMSRHSIYRAVADLEQHERVRVHRRRNKPNTYALTFSDEIPWVRRQLDVAHCDTGAVAA